MIIDSKGMKETEAASGIPVEELMETAGMSAAEEIKKLVEPGAKIVILCGSGNNGGDGFVICRALNEYDCCVIPVDGRAKTDAAKAAWKKVPRGKKKTVNDLAEVLKTADAVIDCVYGFGYHGSLKPEIRRIFGMVNTSGRRVFSIDINSGAEADTGRYDVDAIVSEVTFALECYKPFHMLRKEHRLFEKTVLVSLGLPHTVPTKYAEMNEDLFFRSFPKKKETAYKGSDGKVLLAGGCYGMAGALSLNITGAETLGASYIEVALPESIYPIEAIKHTTAVFHPFGMQTAMQVVSDAVSHAKAIAFGSGAVYMEKKRDVMDIILQNRKAPVVLDAEGLRLLQHNTYILRFVKCPLIITPHIGEFADLINLPVETVMSARLSAAAAFARENKIFVVLKGPHTIVASPDGDIYINQSGNEALAQAGSGDLLTGMIAAMLTFVPDVFKAVCMAVWLHGWLAEKGCSQYAKQTFRLESFPELMNRVFMDHGY